MTAADKPDSKMASLDSNACWREHHFPGVHCNPVRIFQDGGSTAFLVRTLYCKPVHMFRDGGSTNFLVHKRIVYKNAGLKAGHLENVFWAKGGGTTYSTQHQRNKVTV